MLKRACGIRVNNLSNFDTNNFFFTSLFYFLWFDHTTWFVLTTDVSDATFFFKFIGRSYKRYNIFTLFWEKNRSHCQKAFGILTFVFGLDPAKFTPPLSELRSVHFDCLTSFRPSQEDSSSISSILQDSSFQSRSR